MAKKNKKKRKDREFTFSEFLKDNEEEVTLIENGKKVPLEDAVRDSASRITAVPFDAVLAVSPEEATEGKNVNFGLASHFSGSVYKLFELGMVNPIPYTIVFTVDAEDADYIFRPEWNYDMKMIMSRSNLDLIINEGRKKLAKISHWAEEIPEENEFDMFVVNIPDIVMFKTGIKDGTAETIRFNLCIQVVKGKKRISKVKKRGGDSLETLCKFVTKCTLENIKDFGFSNLVIPLTDDFAEDMYAVTDNWKIFLDNDENLPKLVNRINFTTRDTTDYAIISRYCQEYEEKNHKA